MVRPNGRRLGLMDELLPRRMDVPILGCHLGQRQRQRAPMLRRATVFWRDSAGVTAIEYGLIAALIAVVIASAVTVVGNDVKSVFTHVSTEL